jgi:hypothetical protein
MTGISTELQIKEKVNFVSRRKSSAAAVALAPSAVLVAPPPPPVVQEVHDCICKYCKLEFPRRKIDEHENYCGSRTEQCPECSDFVMLKEWEKHQSMRLYHGSIRISICRPSRRVVDHHNFRCRISQ